MSVFQDGLWAMEIGDKLGVIPVGVVFFKQGELFGGNNRYFYRGRYHVNDDKFEADVRVKHYNDVPGSLFGQADEMPFKISGVASESEMDLVGSLPTRPDTELMVRLHKLSAAN